MSNRLLAALILLTVLPLVLLGWISTSAVRNEEMRSRETLEAFFQQRLDATAVEAQLLLDEIQSELQSSTRTKANIRDQLGVLRRNSPLVKLTFLIDRRGVLTYPAIPDQIDSERAEDYLEIDELVGGRPVWSTKEANQSAEFSSIVQAIWMPWYRQQGLQLVLWIPSDRGETIGILLNRTAWISRLVARLPDTELFVQPRDVGLEKLSAAPKTRVRLVDSQQDTIYQWEAMSDGGDDDGPWWVLSEANLPGPLSAWSLRYESLTPIVGSRSNATPIIIGLFGIALLLVVLGIYVATSMGRQMRLAAQHVSFAGQVSHELRTPLTNIRLYAEMAQEDLTKAFQSVDVSSDSSHSLMANVQRKLSVIEQETQRLGRLCTSVLELIKHPHQANNGRCAQINLGNTIDKIVDQFRPSLQQAGIVTDIIVPVDTQICIDQDALEMALMNLISNVEKYASSGKRLTISAEVLERGIHVYVEDCGAGIAKRNRKAIFRPFVRLDSSISAPSGTGIGLSIARQAARRAGGDLVLVNSNVGARFKLELPIG